MKNKIEVKMEKLENGVRFKVTEYSQHTPTPWKVHHKRGYRYWLKSVKDQDIGILYSDDATARANAAFIVRAVNCHSELLEIAKVLCDMAKKGMQPSHERLEDYRRAIAKAEGK